MFPFQRSCELSFKISDDGEQSEQNNLEDQIMFENNNVSVELNNSTNSTTNNNNLGRGRGRGRGRRSSLLAGANNDETERRILHRENERQRRQEMSNLFNSLRDSLPAELIQGKRSISDHVGEAINYIQHLKKNVMELEEKKNELKKSVESCSSTREIGESSNTGFTESCVVIRQSVVGFEIEIIIGFDDEEFLLSNALQIVFDEGLDVVSSTSTKFNERLVHSLQCQVNTQLHVIL
ncbi:unnamed protein product [Amaranthus hypochondriacus]